MPADNEIQPAPAQASGSQGNAESNSKTKSVKEKVELKKFPQEKEEWPEWVKDLKDHLWNYGDRSTWVIEEDLQRRNRLKPPNLTPNDVFDHQMTVLTELRRSFKDCNESEVAEVDITKENFATDLFKKLQQAWHPSDYSNVAKKIDELSQAYKFVGNPITFFQKIKSIRNWLDRAGHTPNEIEVNKGCIDAIYAFANRKKASPTDKMWTTWLAQFERENKGKKFTLSDLARDMTDQYDTYLRMKAQENKEAKNSDNELATFYTGDNHHRRRHRGRSREPESGGYPRNVRPARGSYSQEPGSRGNWKGGANFQHHASQEGDRGRSRDRDPRGNRNRQRSLSGSRGRDRFRGRGGSPHPRGRSEDRDYRGKRKYPYRETSNPRSDKAPRDRNGKPIKCKLCKGPHFLDDCPHLEDAQSKYSRMEHQSHHTHHKNKRNNNYGMNTHHSTHHSEESEDERQRYPSEYSEDSEDESDVSRGSVHHHNPFDMCTFTFNHIPSEHTLNKKQTIKDAKSYACSMMRAMMIFMLLPLMIPIRAATHIYTKTKHIHWRTECTHTYNKGVKRAHTYITHDVPTNTFRTLRTLFLCTCAMLFHLPLYLMCKLLLHTFLHLKRTLLYTLIITQTVITVSAMLTTNLSPITYDDDGEDVITCTMGTSMLYRYKHIKSLSQHEHISMVNWIPMIFNAARDALTSPSSDRERELVCNTSFDHLPSLQEGEEWMIADSGANRHYHPHTKHIFRRETQKQNISGMTGSGQAATEEFGIFAARLEDDEGNDLPITSVAYSVPNGKVGLFSEVQVCFAGNTVIHKGHPERGKHGIILKGSNTFIPYHFDRQTLLWWIKIKPATHKHMMHARTIDPHQNQL